MGLVVDWVAPDPTSVGARLADRLRLPRPDPDDDRFVLLLAGGVIRVARSAPDGREQLIGVAATEPGGGDSADRSDGSALDDAGVRLLGVGWATVDLTRGASELAARLGLDPGGFRSSEEDGWLGAASLVARVGGSSLVVLEPITEGRVAAALARFGEGPVAVYLGLPGPASGTVRPGPLGAGSLVTGAPAWGPFAIVLALAATGTDRLGGAAAGTIER